MDAVPITLTAPNLAASNFTVSPQTAEIGNQATLTLNWTVTNTSTVATNQSWVDTIYLSPTSVFNVNTATMLTSAPNKSALMGGASYTSTLTNVAVPNLAAGSYFVFVVVNSNFAIYHSTYNEQPESDAADNTLAAANPLTLTVPAVNLQVSNPQVTNNSLVDGQSINVSFQVNNVGTETAESSWYDGVYISSSSTFSANSSTLIDTYLPSQSPLNAGASYTQSTSIDIPDTQAPGSYYLFFVANYEHGTSQGQGESNYSDNASAPVAITVNAPELSIAINSAPTTAKLNDSVSISWTVTNISTQYAAYASWEDAVYLSSSPTYTQNGSGQTQVAYEYVSNYGTPLAAGGQYSENATFNIPNTSTGPMYLLFVTDIYDDQGQTTRANDVASSPITLSAPQVNLQVVPNSTSVTPTSAGAGTYVSVSWSVMNSGTDPANGPWEDYIYISSKNTLDSSAELLDDSSSPPVSSLPLAANASYNQTDGGLFLPSNLTPGPYFLFVVANGNSGQSVTNTTDNVSAAIPLTITPPPEADLQVISVMVPAAAIDGSSISVSWTVKNTGNAAASGSWEDAVYVSANSTLDDTAQFLGYFIENQTLAAGTGQYTDTETVPLTNLTSTITGPAYILVQADDQESLTESNYNNNAGPSNSIQLSAPSLTVTAPQAPATGVIGSTIPISWTVTNTSSVDAQVSWYDAVYISPDNVFDGNAHYIGSFAAPNILAAGKNYTQNENIILPTTDTGPEFLLIVADQNNAQPQTGTDNVSAATIDVSGADLTVTAVNGPTSSVSLGQSTNVSWTVTNGGSGPADEDWSDNVYISSKNTLDSSATFLTSVDVGTNSPLAAGASYTQSSPVTIPAGLTAGSYFILVDANANDGQLETNLNNNVTASAAFTIAGADLTVPTASAPANANFGQSVTVSWTVQNTGNGIASQSWTDGIYLSSKSTFDNSATLLKRVASGSNSPLAAGSSYNQSAQVTLPLGDQSANGTFFLFVVTNDQQQQAEISLSDNVSAAQPIALTLPPLPDLVVPVSSIAAPASRLQQPADIRVLERPEQRGSGGQRPVGR